MIYYHLIYKKTSSKLSTWKSEERNGERDEKLIIE